MAVIMSHVFDYENELNDNLYNMKMAGNNNSINNISINNNNNNNNKSKNNSSRRVRKLLKPLLRLLKKKSYKFATRYHEDTVVSQSEIFTEEVDNQNNSNEALEQRLIADLENAEEGAAITVCLDGQMTVVPVVPGQCYVPVHFAHTHAGDFYWTTITLADSDLCYKERAFSQNQLPEMQVA